MRVLIAYYSRSGNTRSLAGAIAGSLRACGVEVEVEEIADRKNRAGVLGWLGGGRDAVLGRSAEIAPPRAEPASFDAVVVGTPVWAWTAAPAALAFCRGGAGAVKKAALFCTMGGSGAKGAFAAMGAALGLAPLAKLALTERQLKDEKALAEGASEFAARLTGS